MSPTQSSRRPPKVLVLYHYFHPDDVVSARHFSDLSADLVKLGWDVEARPSNRSCRDESAPAFASNEQWEGVRIRRLGRPALRQATTYGRALNAAWMITGWSSLAFTSDPPDVVLVGSDPPLSIAVARAWRAARPNVGVAHWCFDLFPEAASTSGQLGKRSTAAARFIARAGYASCDLIADVGPCMRARLDGYGHGAHRTTIVPWALSEPAVRRDPDPATRVALFGNTRLAVLYSGNFGRAHTHEALLQLARELRHDGIQFRFSVRGNSEEALRAAVTASDTNVSLTPFVPAAQLETHLEAADIHLTSLRDDWSGIAVPSKFFGSLACGRPVVFAGPRSSAIARWIEEYQVGWVLDARSMRDVVHALRALAASKEGLFRLQQRCFETYAAHFSRARATSAWDKELRLLVSSRDPG